MAVPIHWITCRTCGKQLGYVVGSPAREHRQLGRPCDHVPVYNRFTAGIARELLRGGHVDVSTQERLFA